MASATHRFLLASTCALALVSPGLAHADEAPPPPAPVAPVPAAAGTHEAAEDLPLRFRDMLAFEAERARTERWFNGVIGSLSSLGLIAAGSISLATASPSDPNAGVVRSYGYVMLSVGGTALIASLIGMIPQSSAERLYEEYNPIAEDSHYDHEWRIRRGEDALRLAAEKDARMRRIVGAVSIAAGIGVAGISVWRATWTGLSPADRAVSGTLTGASALLALGQGIAHIWFMRGSAEIALAHWQASQGRMREAEPPPKTSLSVSPLIAPVSGGFVGGLAGTF